MTAKTTNKLWTALAVSMAWAIVMAGAISVALPMTSHAQQTDRLAPRSLDARQYDSCMSLTKSDPNSAHDSALAWHKKGGGDAAVHCTAVALLGLGQHVQAGQMLEELASRADKTRSALKAGLLGQAANAWLIAGKPAQSESLLTDALQLAPQDVELLVDRSVARATQGKYWDALDDLNEALVHDPTRADALTYRASAWRRVAALELAEKDVAAALNRRPDYPEGLLERGLIRRARGNATGARADWLRVLEIAVDGPLTEAARRNLEILDVKNR